MRTVHCSDHREECLTRGVSTQGGCLPRGCLLGRGCLPRGCVSTWGCVCLWGVCQGEVCIPACTEADTPLWTEWQTGVKTLPCRNFIADSNKLNIKEWKSFTCWLTRSSLYRAEYSSSCIVLGSWSNVWLVLQITSKRGLLGGPVPSLVLSSSSSMYNSMPSLHLSKDSGIHPTSI